MTTPENARKAPKDIAEFLEIYEGRDQNVKTGRKYKKRFVEILVAAANQFSENGYANTSVQSIAESLELRQGAIYYYLPSKERALELICDVAIEGYVEFSNQILDESCSASEKIRMLVKQHLSTLETRPSFFKVFQANRGDLEETARKNIGRKIRSYENNVRRIVASGRKSGEFNDAIDPVAVTLLILSMCNSAVMWHEKRKVGSIEEIAEWIIELTLFGITRK